MFDGWTELIRKNRKSFLAISTRDFLEPSASPFTAAHTSEPRKELKTAHMSDAVFFVCLLFPAAGKTSLHADTAKLLITQWGIRRIFMSIFVRQIIVDYIINLTIKSYELDYRTR